MLHKTCLSVVPRGTPIRLSTGIRLCLLNDISEVNECCKVGTNKESFLLWLTWRCNAPINSEVICTRRELFHVCKLAGQWDTRLRTLIMYSRSFPHWNQLFHYGESFRPLYISVDQTLFSGDFFLSLCEVIHLYSCGNFGKTKLKNLSFCLPFVYF